MRRSYIFFIILIAFIAVLQWDGLSDLLDGILGGIQWSGRIVSFLQENTQGLILLLLIGLFFEFKDGCKSSHDYIAKHEIGTTSYNLLKSAIVTSEGKALAQLGFAKLYGEEAATQMVENLFIESDVLKALDVSLALQETKNAFLIDVELSYETPDNRFLVAVSRSTGLIESLLATGEVNEAFYSNDPNLGIPATIKRIPKFYDSNSKDVELLNMEKLPAKQKRKIARRIGLPGTLIDDFELFEEVNSISEIPNKQLARFVINYRISQSKGCPFAYWMNDRISLVRQVKIDVKALAPKQQNAVKVHRFMASSRWRAETQFHNGVCVIPLDLWSVPGDGIVVTWFEDTKEL
ncbi:hypothetical protein [Roseovarius sp. D22-M7]|uniref:hypothetical protein n=1 Tax=Roseovarius sp. D22-M7 TaxID=3127116 RepID=UPI00300FCC66